MGEITSILKTYRSFFLSANLFLLLIIISILNEILDLPHHIFGFVLTPVNIPEMLFETTSLVLFGIVINWIILCSTRHHLTHQKLILASLEEKEYLLKEIHHRIKNNLSLITSIVCLQERSVSDDKMKNILLNLKNRINSIALIHEKIYLSDDLNTVNLASYFTDLLNEILNISTKKIDLKLDIDDLHLDPKSVIPIALITNELVTNSIKHAFADESSPNIWISFKKIDKEYSLCIGNNGSPLPGDFSIEKSPSLGLTIVNSLIIQLSGELTIHTTPHTEIKIQFPSS